MTYAEKAIALKLADDIAVLQKRLRLNRVQFARVLGVSPSRLDDIKGIRKPGADPSVEVEIIINALARLVDVIRSE